MHLVTRLVTDHCSAGCSHCPYARVVGEDFLPPTEAEPGEVSILTGGDPLESPALRQWVDWQISQHFPFRIATGGHIPVNGWRAQLRNEPLFLGFNFGTDVLLAGTDSQRASWLENWRLAGRDTGTWLTITVGDHLSADRALNLVRVLKPSTVMINAVEGYSEIGYDSIIALKKFKEINIVEGFLR